MPSVTAMICRPCGYARGGGWPDRLVAGVRDGANAFPFVASTVARADGLPRARLGAPRFGQRNKVGEVGRMWRARVGTYWQAPGFQVDGCSTRDG